MSFSVIIQMESLLVRIGLAAGAPHTRSTKIVKEKPIGQARQQAMNAVTIEKFYRKLGDTTK
jgi:hypothetical protein